MNAPRKPKRHGLSRASTYRYARELLDFDYLRDLDESQLDFLDKFAREFYQNTFRRDDTDLHDDDKRRECYRNTNARQRDMWNQFHRAPQDYQGNTDVADDEEDDK